MGCSTVEKTVEELKRAGDELENKKWLERGVSGSVVLCLVFDSEDTYGEGAGLYQGVLIPKDATASTVNFSKEDIETVGFED